MEEDAKRSGVFFCNGGRVDINMGVKGGRENVNKTRLGTQGRSNVSGRWAVVT